MNVVIKLFKSNRGFNPIWKLSNHSIKQVLDRSVSLQLQKSNQEKSQISKMKLSILASASAFTLNNENSERGLHQLQEMVYHYNNDYHGRKYASYGCHCHYYGKSIKIVKQKLNENLRRTHIKNG